MNENEFIAFVLHKERQVGIMTKEHEHRLVFSLTNFDWKCNVCNSVNNRREGKYYCSLCDYNMCDKCRDKGYYDKKRDFPKDMPICSIKFKNKFLKTSFHEHNLVFCKTSRIVLGRTYWKCNKCRKGYNDDVWAFYCTKCDFDLCSDCAGIHKK